MAKDLQLEALWEAYRSTRFEADTPLGKMSIRVGQMHGEVDALLGRNGRKDWCFITAWNPGSEILSAKQNHERNRALKQELEALGRDRFFCGMGWPAEEGWQPEESFLVLGVGCKQAMELGRRHGQNAVVWGELGGASVLLDCRVDSD